MDEVPPERVNLLSWHGVNWQGMRARDRANDKRTTAWAFAWVFSLVLARVPVVYGLLPPWTGWILGALSLAVGAQFVRAYLRMVREADELLRQVQLEGLAVGCGAGLICGLTTMYFTQPGGWWAMAVLIPMSVGYLGRVLLAAHSAARAAR